MERKSVKGMKIMGLPDKIMSHLMTKQISNNAEANDKLCFATLKSRKGSPPNRDAKQEYRAK